MNPEHFGLLLNAKYKKMEKSLMIQPGGHEAGTSPILSLLNKPNHHV
jgi:hypothetical protein